MFSRYGMLVIVRMSFTSCEDRQLTTVAYSEAILPVFTFVGWEFMCSCFATY